MMSDQETADYIDHDFVRPFDLLSGEPLLRLELIETETSNWLLVDIHHSIGDGVTLAPNMTIYDIPAAYNGDALEDRSVQRTMNVPHNIIRRSLQE